MTVPSQNVDDYYSSISDSSDAKAQSPDIEKKKLKLKIKKVESSSPHEEEKKFSWNEEQENVHEIENVKEKEISLDSKWTKSKQEMSLNDALNTDVRSKFTVVSRVSEVKSEEKNEISEETDGEEVKIQTEIIAPLVEKPVAKFKPGFSKVNIKKAPVPEQSFEEKKGSKKAKIFSEVRNQKYKKWFESEENSFIRSGKMKTKKKIEKRVEDIEQTLKSRVGEVVIVGEILSIKEFSEKIGVPLAQLIAEFMKNGILVTLNSQIDFDTASLIAESFEVKLEKDISGGVKIDDLASGNIKDFLWEDDASKLETRAPVISIMGHVDHGKTSLLDYIRKSQIASGEAGWITQSIGAYQVEHNDKKITFLDTPGHEAFTIMRSRGAKSTDIAILVVAADEGVKPQTIESIAHAKEANIPVIVAINKMDKEGANPDYVKSQLSEHGLIPEDWGGDTPMVPVSAHTGFWVNDLLEIILLMAEMLELKANSERNAIATILESHLDVQLGPVATVLINAGTLRKWDSIVCATSYGKVKVLHDFLHKGIKSATPGMPALVVGLDNVVEWGDILQVVSGIDVAREKALQYQEYMRSQKKLKSSQLDILMSRIKSGSLKQLKIVVKADTNGSLEAIKNALLKLSTPETTVSLIHTGVGNITEGDVLMCWGSSAILIGFWVSVGINARKWLEDSRVEYIESKIIYHITERIEKIVTWMLDPRETEVILCNAKVGGIFYASKKFQIIGLVLSQEESTIEKNALVRVFRGDKLVWKGKIESLKQWVEEVNKLEGPIECGIKLVGVSEVLEKDIVEVYKIHIEK